MFFFSKVKGMNLIVIEQKELRGSRVRLTDRRAKHIAKVLRAVPGETVKIGVVNGPIGFGTIVNLCSTFPFSVEIDVDCKRRPPAKGPVDFILALPRPIMLRRIMSQATALGVGNIHIINANRVEKSFWSSGAIEESEWHDLILQGLEQCIDTVPPKISFHRRFRPFVEDSLPEIAQGYSACLYAHPESEKKLHNCLGGDEQKILIAIGPEGGWVDFEADMFRQLGFFGFTLGERILKVDTAVINIHGRAVAHLQR